MEIARNIRVSLGWLVCITSVKKPKYMPTDRSKSILFVLCLGVYFYFYFFFCAVGALCMFSYF